VDLCKGWPERGTFLLLYILAINIIGFLIMWYDKAMARARKYRIPESRLFLIAIAGGSVGIYLGIHLFKHKVNKLIFTLGVPVIFITQIILFRNLR
jgi:uncharacterized membrane protein YsdA (DUF1294 family)